MNSVPQPLPRISAFEKLGFGMFIHWGLYSQLGKGEWVRHAHKLPQEEYAKLSDSFTAEDFNAEEFARIAHEAGMRYIVLTTRHHEGFSLYDTKGLSLFDAPHSAAKRDLVAEFVAGCRKYDIVPFFYHTTLDWQWENAYSSELSEEDFQRYLHYLEASVELLCRNYGKIGGFWFDGNWSRPQSDWHEERLYGMIRRYQPDAIIINNSGLFAQGAFGHPELDSVTFEQNSARPLDRSGMKKYVAAEVCKTMNTHWGVGNNDFNFLSPKDVIEKLCHSRGCGANFLLNVGPEAQGRIPDYEKAVLTIVGKWCRMHQEAIYQPKAVADVVCGGRDFLLQDGNCYYYFVFDLKVVGDENVVVDGHNKGLRKIGNFRKKVKECYYLDNGQILQHALDESSGELSLLLKGYPYGTNLVVRVVKLVTEE